MNSIIISIISAIAAFIGAFFGYSAAEFILYIYRIRKIKIKRICNHSMRIHFENVVSGDWSDEIGPFAYVQLTYSSLRAATPDGEIIEDLAVIEQNGLWNYNGLEYTDVVISEK